MEHRELSAMLITGATTGLGSAGVTATTGVAAVVGAVAVTT